MFVRPGLFLWIWLSCTVVSAQNAPPEASRFRNYDVARQNVKQNMCPFLVQGNKRLPVICWMCHFPQGMHANNHYVYDCCPGYSRGDLDDGKCMSMESTWKDLINYLKDRGHSKTVKALVSNTAIAELATQTFGKVYTVFVPKNDDDIENAELDYTGRDNSARMLVLVGRHYSNRFVNGRTLRNEKSVDLKITTYSNGLTFLECRLVLSVDHETTTGVVHFLDGVIPATNRFPTVLSRLTSNPEISAFVQALPHDVRVALDRRDATKWYTVIAPTNRAWNEAVQKLLDGESAADLARHHVMDKMLCSGAILKHSGPVGPTEAKDYVKFTLTQTGDAAVVDACNEEIPFFRKDLMSGTGVVHVVDKAITNMKAFGLSEALNCLSRVPDSGMARAAKEFIDCGLASRSKANVILLPHDEAFTWLHSISANHPAAERMRADSRYRCDVYSYHMLTATNVNLLGPQRRGFLQEQRFKTDYVTPNRMDTYVTSYYIKERDGSKLNFNEANVQNTQPLRFRNGLIYLVRTLNFPPEKTMLELIKSQYDMREIAQKIEQTDMEEELKRMNGQVLLLAPIDRGWGSRELENAYSVSQTRKLLRLHTIPHALFGGENGFLLHSTVQTVDSLLPGKGGEKVKLIIKRDLDGNTFIGHSELPEQLWAMVLRWNMVATDGVIWAIDWPIKCPELDC